MTPPDVDPEQLERLLATLAGLSAALYGTDPALRQIVVPAGTSRAHDDKARAEARYQALVEQIPAITFTVSLEEGVPDIYIGPQIEQILGFTQEEWMDDPILWFAQCHPDDRDIWHQEFARGIQTGGPFRAQCRVFAKDGRIVWLHGEARLVRSDQGQPLFLQGIAFDVTDQKLAEQKMKEAQEVRVLNERLHAVGQMAASIGHDLRNPIGAIRNAWTFVEGRVSSVPEVQSDARLQQMFGIIGRELGRCTSILSELLEFARDRAPHRTATHLAALVDEVVGVVAKPAPTITLENRVPADLPPIAVDADQMRQVLVNLAQNAVEAVSKSGTAWIEARVDEDGATVIDVVDDGKGIAPELRDSVWKPLFTTKKRGTGLGLPIVANIVGRHEGLISFESAPGKGTRFRVALPPRDVSSEPEPDRGGAVEL